MNESRKNLTVDPNLLQAKPQVVGGPNATVASDECFVAIKDPHRPKRLRASVCLWLFILILAFGVQSVSAQTVWSEGYWYPYNYTDTSTITQWSALSHIGMSAAEPNSNGSLFFEPNFTTDAPALITAAHANGVKVLFMLTPVGGNGAWAGATNSTNLSTFITNIMAQVNTYGFDGVELDWEGADAFNLSQATNMISSMRTALGSKLLVADTPAVGNGSCQTGATYTAASVTLMDRILIETYDQNGTWEPETAFSAPLYVPSGSGLQSVSGHIAAALNCGYPAAKLMLGIPFYDYISTPNTGPYQAFGGSPVLTQITYATGLATYGYGGSTYDSYAHVPWKAIGSSWLQWENAQSVTDKINYAYANGLGGWGLWTLGQDYTSGASPTMPLLAAVGAAFAPKLQPPTGLKISVN
jgi:chitinase